MKWWKHMSDMSISDRGKYVLSKHGSDGYARWCLILEMIAQAMDRNKPDVCYREMPINEWCKSLKINKRRLIDFLADVGDKLGLYWEISENMLKVEVPEMLKLVDDSTKKAQVAKRNSGIVTEQDKYEYEDKDKNKDKDIYKDEEVKVETVKECELKEIVNYLNEKTSTNFRHNCSKTRNLINERMNEGFKLEDFKKVIDIKCAEWLIDSKMSKFLRPETLFGNKFEGYLNQPISIAKKYGISEQTARNMNSLKRFNEQFEEKKLMQIKGVIDVGQ